MKTLKIKVTRKHISMGKEGELTSCPIALALKAAGLQRPYVGFDNIGYTLKLPTGPKRVRIKSPKAARQFVKDFDRGWKRCPIEFNLNVPCDFHPTPQTKP